jgi:hypothetical protein
VDLGRGDWVEWWFEGDFQGGIPGVRFEDPFGPFQCLQSFARNTVVGKGNTGAESERAYAYTALVLNANGVQARSADGAGSVRNLPQPANSSPDVMIQFREDGGLEVRPEALRLGSGDTATWHFFGLPEGGFATVWFPGVLPLGADPLVGPFQSLVIRRRVEGEDPGVVRISGLGFAGVPEMSESRYFYRIEIRAADGRILGSHDPMIDNLGQPGPPSEEEG